MSKSLIDQKTEKGLAALAVIEKAMDADAKKPDDESPEEKAMSDEECEKALAEFEKAFEEEKEKAMPDYLKKFKTAKHAKGDKDGEKSTEKAITAVPDFSSMIAKGLSDGLAMLPSLVNAAVEKSMGEKQSVGAVVASQPDNTVAELQGKIAALEKSIAAIGDTPAVRGSVASGNPVSASAKSPFKSVDAAREALAAAGFNDIARAEALGALTILERSVAAGDAAQGKQIVGALAEKHGVAILDALVQKGATQ
jgi:hypothetical protein